MNLDREELQSLVEDVIASRAYHAWEEAGLDITIAMNNDTPTITVSTGDEDISVNVETVELTDNNEVKGWTFEVSMDTVNKTFVLSYENGSDEATEFYSRCANIANFAKILAETDIYPEQYFE